MMTLMLMRMAFRAIFHHAVRSLLTLLGIVIGIAGIIAISAVGKGAQEKARAQFLTYGSKSIDLHAGNWMTPSKKPFKLLQLDDIDMIAAQCPAVQYASPFFSQYQVALAYEGHESSAVIEGTNEHFLKITEEKLQQGFYFTQQHIERRENVVVLSPKIAEFFFKLSNPVGSVIRIHKIPFTVVGVLAPRKVKGRWEGMGLSSVFIPFSTHQKIFKRRILKIAMSTYAEEQVAETTRRLEKIFRAAHFLEENEPNDFRVWDMQTIAAAAEEASKSVGLFSLIAAIIALLVGGIGVMNIMLVAVKERTKEIGIKVALGATMNTIRMQFLTEAVVICMLGGIIGIIFGVASCFVLNQWMGIATIVEIIPIAVSFFVTVLIGLVFGFYPAEWAARLKPVDALTES